MTTLSERLAGLAPTAGQRLPRNTLGLFLPDGWPESGREIQWYVRSGANVSHGRAADLADLPTNLKATQLLVWTPPADTLLTQTILPTSSWSKIAQALPYALEDQVLGNPEDLHFAYQRQRDGGLAVAVTARERLTTWLDELHSADLRPMRLCPATLALPLQDQTWSVAFADGGLLVRTGAFTGFACAASVDRPPPVLTAALDEVRGRHDMPSELVVFNPPEGFSSDAWTSVLDVSVIISNRNFWEDGVSAFAALNLLQGDFALTGKLQDTLRPLLPVFVILGIWLAGTLAFTVWEWWQLNQAQQSDRQAMTALFRKTFPQAKTVLDPALQMQRNLETLQAKSGQTGANDLLSLLAHATPMLRAKNDVTLRTLKYADGKLTLDLSLPDFEALEVMKNAMSTTGKLEVEVLAANSRASGVEGRLRIQAASLTEQNGQ
ncbi:MAG: type II secretion system protein GspL [Acidiferrobacterales bacterium]